MNEKRFTLFTKLMMLSTSDQDGEALTALRKANSILAEENINWEELFNTRITITREAPRKEHKEKAQGRGESYKPQRRYTIYDNDEEITEMLEFLIRNISPNDSFLHFIQSVYGWYKDKGFLTERQYEAVKASYLRRKM